MDVYFDSNRISLNLAMGKTFMNIRMIAIKMM
jgi:hypothetical protein